MAKNPTKAPRTPRAESSSRATPSLAAMAALVTLAMALWFDMELSTALFRAVLVFLGLSVVTLAYRVALTHYLSASQARGQAQVLNRLQREAESEMRQPTQGTRPPLPAKTATAKNGKAPVSAGPENRELKNAKEPVA